MQNSVDKHLSSLHAWSRKEFQECSKWKSLKLGIFLWTYSYSSLPLRLAWIHEHQCPSHRSHISMLKSYFVWLCFQLIALCYDKICPSASGDQKRPEYQYECKGISVSEQRWMGLLSVFRLHELHHKWINGHYNPIEVHQIEPKTAVELNEFEMWAHNLNSVHFVTIKLRRPFFDKPFAKNGSCTTFSFDL